MQNSGDGFKRRNLFQKDSEMVPFLFLFYWKLSYRKPPPPPEYFPKM